MIVYKLKDGSTSGVKPVVDKPVVVKPIAKPKRVVNLDKRMKINSAGFETLNKIKGYLIANPNQSAKEIGANFDDINFHTIRYMLARSVKYQHLIVTTGAIPLYNVNPTKVFNKNI